MLYSIFTTADWSSHNVLIITQCEHLKCTHREFQVYHNRFWCEHDMETTKRRVQNEEQCIIIKRAFHTVPKEILLKFLIIGDYGVGKLYFNNCFKMLQYKQRMEITSCESFLWLHCFCHYWYGNELFIKKKLMLRCS